MMDKKIMLSVITAGTLILGTSVTALAASNTAQHSVQHPTAHLSASKLVKTIVTSHSSPKMTKRSIITNRNTGNNAPTHDSRITSKENKGHQGTKKNTISDGIYTDNFAELGVPTHGTARVVDNGTELTGTDNVVYRGKHYTVTFNQTLSGYDITGGKYTTKSPSGSTKTVTLSGLNVPLKRDGRHLTPSVSLFTVAEIMQQVIKK